MDLQDRYTLRHKGRPALRPTQSHGSELQQAQPRLDDNPALPALEGSTLSEPHRPPKSILWTKDRSRWAEACHRSVSAFGNDDCQRPTFRGPIDPFEYQPLDLTQPSIRLIYILPDLSQEGFLQCRLIHASTSDDYVCLSYVWNYPHGPENHVLEDWNERVILISGKPYPVRENLFDFLCMARHNGARMQGDKRRFDLWVPIWIDALCIDQFSSLERNHQVAQMGNIYSRASWVHVWFGKADLNTSNNMHGTVSKDSLNHQALTVLERVCRLLEDVSIASENVRHSFYDAKRADILERHSVCNFVISICCNTYWKRAWVVQEMLLAGTNTFWLNTEPLDAVSIDKVADLFQSTRLSHFSSKLQEEGAHYLAFHSSALKLPRGSDLISLIGLYSNKECADPRDRVYSLLSLCSARSRVNVDYDINIAVLAY